MYRAKQSGGGRYEIFDKHLEVCVTSQQERERELRYGLDKRLFEFLYQPIYRLHDGRLEGFESCRWRRADGIDGQFRRSAGRGRGDRALDYAGPGDDGGGVQAVAQLERALPEEDLSLTVNLTHRQFYQSRSGVAVEEGL